MQNVFKALSFSVRETTRLIIKNYLFLPALVLLYFAWSFVSSLLPGNNFGMQLLQGLLLLVALTYIYSWSQILVRDGKLLVSEMGRFNYPILSGLAGAGFTLWIISIFTTPFAAANSPAPWLPPAVGAICFFLFNALPEVVYVKGITEWVMLRYTMSFIEKNGLAWFTPVLLMNLPALLHNDLKTALANIFTGNPIVPFVQVWAALTTAASYTLNPLLLTIFTTCLVGWLVVFRGVYFRRLDEGR